MRIIFGVLILFIAIYFAVKQISECKESGGTLLRDAYGIYRCYDARLIKDAEK